MDEVCQLSSAGPAAHMQEPCNVCKLRQECPYTYVAAATQSLQEILLASEEQSLLAAFFVFA